MKLKEIKVTNSYLNLGEEFYKFVTPSPLKKSSIIDINKDFAQKIMLKLEANEWLKLLSLKEYFSNSKPYSMVYAGHQYGYFVPELGDGRVVNIGELKGFLLQLKGVGPTPFARGADGRASINEALKEYLASIFINALNIKTIKAIAIAKTGFKVYHYNWYDGAIIFRALNCFIRFGSLEYFAKNKANLKKLINYIINYRFSFISSDIYRSLYALIVKSSAKNLAKWMSVGFCHGLLNSDNFLIDGSIIDYGTFGFIENFNKDYSCNKKDKKRRYSFFNQPRVVKWNLLKLLEVFAILEDKLKLQQELDKFDTIFYKNYYRLISNKIGLNSTNKELINTLFNIKEPINYTLFFKHLTTFEYDKILNNLSYKKELKEWLNNYLKFLEKDFNKNIVLNMKTINPTFTLSSSYLNNIIKEFNLGNVEPFKKALKEVNNPYFY